MNPMDQWFIGLTRQEIDSAVSGWSIPDDVMMMVYVAVNQHEVGIGSGPTLRSVINHYVCEKAYSNDRLLGDMKLQHLLDKAMNYADVGTWNDTTRFKLPSIRCTADMWNIGQFEFMVSDHYNQIIRPQVTRVKAKLRECMPFIKEFEND